ncbi:MAG: putative ABC transporter permease [Bacilli bacterium]|nr:putative ABC transporter permease [Bacilli bacterium]
MKEVFIKYLNDKIKYEKWQLISILFLIVVLSGTFGWIYELIFYYFNGGMKEWYMQGGNFLPWINIYAIGAILIIITTYKVKKKPILVFLISFIVTGILEYISGLLIYKLCNGLRLWNYNKEILNFGNINGFVCLRSVLFFGVSALILVYIMVPTCIYLSKKINKKYFITISIILFSIVIFDEIYNLIIARILNTPRASTIYQSIGIKYVKYK